MLALILAMAVILDSGASPDPATLVKQLGSSRYASRVSAEAELARLGRIALPALRAGKDSKDAEIRMRAVALVAQIEKSLLLQASPIRLDFRDVPLADALEEIGRQISPGLRLSSDEQPTLAGRRITARSDRPLAFWEAVDVFCSAANLHPSPGDLPAEGFPNGSLVLLDGPASSAPVSDDGAFRVHLDSAHYQSEILFHQPSRPSREFFLQLAVSAEPRLAITRNGPIRVTSAVDDLGRSLVGPVEPTSFRQTSGYFGMSPSSILRFRVDLGHPEPLARQIKTLRGVIPVIVTTRKTDPIVISLAESRGRLIRSDEIALTLLEHQPGSEKRAALIQVAIRPLGPTAEPISSGKGEPLGYRPDSFQQQIEVIDAQGRPMPWFPTGSSYDGEETRMTLSLGQPGTSGVPTTLRFHGILKAVADVAFEFRDIPIP